MKSKIMVRNLKEINIASVRKEIPVQQIGETIQELARFCKEYNLTVAGYPTAIYYDKEFNPEKADIEVCFPVTGPFVPDGDFRCRVLPGGKIAAIVHQGGYESIGASYQKIVEWIRGEGHRIIGPRREVYIQGPESVANGSDYKTEIQIPVL